MLRAIQTDKNNDPARLWFRDQEHDLFIWVNRQNEPIAFQFSNDRNSSEHSINWSLDRGYSHDRIDTGEAADGRYKMTPIMVPDGRFDNRKIAERFKAVSADLPSDFSEFIYRTLIAYEE